ncbi:MAG: MBL fold metallo-hydrolase [Bacillota bacterium]|nr:MBL fold metallo-hydrolase [Bacillota bacterium]MDW7685237.1 MBL fold metallo-hydrolase [Bacillota bacterium]
MIEICMLASGSSGNAIYVATDHTRILIDAGLSGKRLAAALAQLGVHPDTLDALVLSHDHNDHICGAGVMARRYKLPVYATAPTWLAGACKMGPLPQDACRILPGSGLTEFADLTVETFPVPHDAAGPVGFVFRHGNRTIALATDLGVVTPVICEKLQHADCLVLESNHDETMVKNSTYPWSLKKRILGENGHLSNTLAAQCLAGIISPVTSHIVLAHLSEQNNLPQLACETVGARLEQAGLGQLSLEVAKRHEPSCHIRFA